MKKIKNILKIIWVLFLIAATSFLFVFGLYCSVENRKKENNQAYEKGYLDACKDFYQGKLKYDLVEHKDGTITWEKVKN